MNDLSGQQSADNETIPRFRGWLFVLAVCLFLLVGAGVGWHFFQTWEEGHLIRQAQVYLKLNDLNSFSRTLGEARRLDPKNAVPCRLYAKTLIRLGDPAALPWLRLAVQLTDGNLDDQMALAEAAFGFGQSSETARVLKNIDPMTQGRADYHDLAGRLAQKAGNLAEAESHYTQAAALAPGNRHYQLQLANVRLESQTPEAQAKARSDLEQLETQPELSNMPLRILIADALKKNWLERAVTLAEKLDAVPGRAFSDHVTYLGVLHQGGDRRFASELAKTQEEVSLAPDKVLPLLGWMNTNNLSLLAKDWVQRLPPEVTAYTPVRIEIAQAYVSTASWKELHAFVANDKWGLFDYMRNAFLARANREIGENGSASQGAWSEALSDAGDNTEALTALARMANEWGWKAEAIDATWQMALHGPQAREATEALCAYYSAKRDTDGLLRAYSLVAKRNPDDAAARNNVALFSLLLNKDKEDALTTARELHEKEPANPTYASTYAFALQRHGKTALALGVMGALKPEALRDPSVAAYYSAILAAAGRLNEAREFRELARTANLLPEEEQLLETGNHPE